jgi:hypothetical protein
VRTRGKRGDKSMGILLILELKLGCFLRDGLLLFVDPVQGRC